MNYFKFLILLFLGVVLFFLLCKNDEDFCIEIVWYEDVDGDGLGNLNVS